MQSTARPRHASQPRVIRVDAAAIRRTPRVIEHVEPHSSAVPVFLGLAGYAVALIGGLGMLGLIAAGL